MLRTMSKTSLIDVGVWLPYMLVCYQYPKQTALKIQKISNKYSVKSFLLINLEQSNGESYSYSRKRKYH